MPLTGKPFNAMAKSRYPTDKKSEISKQLRNLFQKIRSGEFRMDEGKNLRGPRYAAVGTKRKPDEPIDHPLVRFKDNGRHSISEFRNESLKIGVARSSWEGNDVADVGHAGDVLNHTL